MSGLKVKLILDVTPDKVDGKTQIEVSLLQSVTTEVKTCQHKLKML